MLDDHCYVYLAWDKTVTVGGVGKRTEARLARVDVPNGGITDGTTCPTDIDAGVGGTGFIWGAHTWSSNVRVSKVSDNVIWEAYVDTFGDSCAVDFWAYVDTKLDFSTKQLVRLTSASFPLVIPPLGGTAGDWVEATSIGLPGGIAYATWVAARRRRR